MEKPTFLAFLRDLMGFGQDLADTRFPLTVGAIIVLCLVSWRLWTSIRRDRLAARHAEAICNWKLNKVVGLCMQQARVIRVLDRRTVSHAVLEERRKDDEDIESILTEFQRVLAGPTTDEDWEEIESLDHELATKRRLERRAGRARIGLIPEIRRFFYGDHP